MPDHDHAPKARGTAFLLSGIGLGALLIAALFTHGFGLLGGGAVAAREAPALVHDGERILIPQDSPLRSRLVVAPASIQSIDVKLVLPGIVESNPAHTSAVLTPLAGRIMELKVALGDRVARGQALAVIDSPDLAQAFDDNDKAADAFELTRRSLQRQEGQFKLGAASERDLDQARSDHAQAQAEYTRTRARLKVIGADPAEHSRLLVVRAPLSGSVTALSAVAGNMVNDPTQALMTVADLSSVWVTALVPEKDVAAVARGQAAEVNFAAYPDRYLHGKVLFVSDVVEPDTRRNKLRIEFPNVDHALKPNMFATVSLHGGLQRRVVLPSSALLMNNDRTSVFVATAAWTFERRTVEPALEEGGWVVIRSGLAGGESVVVKGGILLND